MDEIIGYIERITFQNDENGYTIAQLQEKGKNSLSCIVGSMPSLQPGETVRCIGEWKNHLVYGRQFAVSSCKTEAPADALGIKKYLGSGLIKGIGTVYASKIVDKFGTETLEIIDKEPERLLEIPRLGKKRVEKICACWSEQKSIRDVMIFLQSYGISPAYAQKIFKVYGSNAIAKVKDNPYDLAKEIFGIGFKTADTIAQNMGIGKETPQRIDAGIEYVLFQLAEEGHVCYPLNDFLLEAEQVLEISENLVKDRLDPLKNQGRIEVFDLVNEGKNMPFIWLSPLFNAEVAIAYELKRIKSAPCTLRTVDTGKAVEWVQDRLNIQLAANQKSAVSDSVKEKVQIITGGPGTGKSTITKAILTITEMLTSRILLAAPTGRAAKRMAEITGRNASTIHSLLQYDFKKHRFKRGRENPLECDLIVVDEASMIDTYLMSCLLKAIPSTARVIFVGDINQLPSVGPGNVLKDMIASKCISVATLNEIFRQAAGSRIITNAHKINKGTLPDIKNTSDSDFFFIEAHEPDAVLNTISALVSQRLPKKFGFDPVNEIQVLAPMKKGVIGTENLNAVLQELLNPSGEPLSRGGKNLKAGDKVMQIRNNYKKEVYNGDIGRIVKIDNIEQQLLIIFDDREVYYEFTELDELVLAYAVSVHKYQGSECPCIIMPIHTAHFKLLHRNLLYTGVTRGKRIVVLVGTTKALFLAVKNDEVKRRYSGLKPALLGIAHETIGNIL